MKLASRLAVSAAVFGFCVSALAQPMEVVLRLKEKVPLEKLAANVTDPQSNRYEQYYTPEEIRDISGPSNKDYKDFTTRLTAMGFDIVNEDKTHLFVTVRAESSFLENIFSTRILTNAMMRTKLVASVRLPEGMEMVDSVIGLDSTNRFYPRWVAKNLPLAQVPSDALSPASIKTLYGFNPLYQAGLSGKGQHIAIATYSGFNMSDIPEYYKNIGLKVAPKVDQVIFNGTPALDPDSAVETETDAEFSGMIAPGAQIHIFASSHNDDSGEVEVFTAILDDNRAKVANYSWGNCESAITPEHKADMDKVFARAVAQGVNIMVASGDSGSDACQDGSNTAGWPADHPDVVAVGGTTANTKGNALAEVSWSGSGGGISALYALPSWQSDLSSPYVRRSYPDVAFNADPNTGENCWVQLPDPNSSDPVMPSWVQIGGTSIAAPQWSGFMALVNQARGSKGTLPFLNTVIYGLSHAQHESFFHDVTEGKNGIYKAGPGWDAVTGWGSMQADSLLTFLRGI